MGIAAMSGLAALLAAALVAWIVYRVARNALTRDRVSRVAAEGAPRAVPPPAT